MDCRIKSGNDEWNKSDFYNLSAKNRINRGARNPDRLPGSSIGSFIQ